MRILKNPMNTKEAAKIAGTSTATIVDLIKKKKIKAVKIGNSYQITSRYDTIKNLRSTYSLSTKKKAREKPKKPNEDEEESWVLPLISLGVFGLAAWSLWPSGEKEEENNTTTPSQSNTPKQQNDEKMLFEILPFHILVIYHEAIGVLLVSGAPNTKLIDEEFFVVDEIKLKQIAFEAENAKSNITFILDKNVPQEEVDKLNAFLNNLGLAFNAVALSADYGNLIFLPSLLKKDI